MAQHCVLKGIQNALVVSCFLYDYLDVSDHWQRLRKLANLCRGQKIRKSDTSGEETKSSNNGKRVFPTLRCSPDHL
eukprot:8743982-Pyramimonas_sp.AAC.1